MALNQSMKESECEEWTRCHISLVIPNRNNEKYLDSCLRSVVSQTDKEFVFIVSDNHSTDGSIEIIDSYKEHITKIISPPSPAGYKDHLFWILEQVQTEYVIFLAGDDIAHSELIHCYRQSLEKNEDSSPAFVCSPFFFIDEHSSIYNKIHWPRQFCGTRSDMLKIFLKGPICNISSVAWNVNNLKSIDIPEVIGNSIDWYLYIMLSNKNKVLLVNKRLLFYRVHHESTGNSNVAAHTENCKRLFIYIKENVFMHDSTVLEQIDANIADFNQIIDGRRTNTYKLIMKKILFSVTVLIYKLHRHPQLKTMK